MPSDRDPHDKAPLGFAGLADLLRAAPQLSQSARQPAPSGSALGPPGAAADPARTLPPKPVASQDRDVHAQANGGAGDPVATLIPLGVLLALIFVGFAIFKHEQRTPARPAPSPAPRTSTAPYQTLVPTPAAKLPKAGARLLEVRPPVGTGATLTTPMISYCLAETIRLEAGEAAIRPDRSADYDRYNAMVDDWNSRCSNYRYYKADMTEAQAEVEPYRSQLAKEGANRVRGRK